MKSARLGILGGTFDPIHVGHLDAADAASAAMALEEIVLIPAYDQPLRVIDPRATAYQRFALAVLAVADRPECHVSEVELLRQGRSYTEDTLRRFHAAGRRTSQLFFILGSDAFAGIAAWHGYPGFLELAHFVVIARPGVSMEEATRRTPELRARMSPAPREPVASDGCRTDFSRSRAHARRLLDDDPGTAREREANDELVPPAVARHIQKHHLYGAVDSLHGEDERI